MSRSGPALVKCTLGESAMQGLHACLKQPVWVWVGLLIDDACVDFESALCGRSACSVVCLLSLQRRGLAVEACHLVSMAHSPAPVLSLLLRWGYCCDASVSN